MATVPTPVPAMHFQPYDWHEGDIDGRFCIRIWAHTSQSERICIVVRDFRPRMIYALPTDIPSLQNINWLSAGTKRDIAHQLSRVNANKAEEEGYTPPDVAVAMKHKLYYNGNVMAPFVQCTFDSVTDMRRFHNLVTKHSYINLSGHPLMLTPVEAQIPMHQRMIASQDLTYAGWTLGQDMHEVTGTHYAITNGVREFVVSYKNLHLDNTIMQTTQPIIGAVDIETFSPDLTSFPNKVEFGNDVFMISLVIQRYQGNPEERIKIVYGLAACEPTAEFNYIQCVDEYDMFERMFEDIRRYGVTVVIGYNIFGYDYDYINARIGVAMRQRYFAGPRFNLIKDGLVRFKEYVLDTPVHGKVDFWVPQMEGVVHVDMMHVIKVEYGTLGKYSLDFVSNHFLGVGKVDITAKDMFIAYNNWLQTRENPPAQVLHDIYKVAVYNMIDSDLCIRLMETLNQWSAMIEQSSIFTVRLEDIHLRGQQLRARNKIHTMCTANNLILDQVKFPKSDFEGAAVLDPQLGLYNNVMILDFNSLYPSIIMAKNICYTTYVPDMPEFNALVPDSMCNVIAWKEPDTGISYRHRFIKREHIHGILPQLCSYYINERKAVRKQIGPQNSPQVNQILNQRQNALKVAGNSLYGVLGTQKGSLILPPGAAAVTATGRISNGMAADFVRKHYGANVIYGDTDSIMITLPGMTNPSEIHAKGLEIAEAVSAQFEEPLRMEFDEMLAVGFFVSKKRYMGFKAWKADGSISVIDTSNPLYNVLQDSKGDMFALMKECKTISQIGIKVNPETGSFCRSQFMIKGLLTARRDNSVWQRRVYDDIMHLVLHGASREHIYNKIDEEIRALLYCQVPIEDLVVNIKLRDAEAGLGSKFGEVLRKRGVMFNSDDVFGYLAYRKPGATSKGERIETPDYVIEHLGCDREYYVSVLTTAIDTILAIAYPISSADQAKLDAQNAATFQRSVESYQKRLADPKNAERTLAKPSAVTNTFRADPIVRSRKKKRNGTIEVTYWNRPYGLFPTATYWDLWERTVRSRRAVMNAILKNVRLIE